MRLLLIEDDADLAAVLKRRLENAAYSVDVCMDGANAAYYLESSAYNAIILDRLLPGKDGLTILKELRAANCPTPVIMLTALDTVENRTEGLDAGADDYLVKPFAMPELLSRIRALLRRPAAVQADDAIACDNLTLSLRECRLRCGDVSKTLSRKEAALFELFFENANRVLPRAEILSRVWGGDEAVEEGNVDNYIYFLRRRLKELDTPVSIRTVHGVGYELVSGE